MEIGFEFPVYSLAGKDILPAGALLDDGLAAQIASRGGAAAKTWPILEHAAVRADLIGFIEQPPYPRVIGPPEPLLELMAESKLVEPVFDFLDHFREQDFSTYHHILMVFALATLMAQCVLDNDEDRAREMVAGPTHDFGKICVPLDILKKRDPLTATERRRLRHHSAAGYVLLSHHLGDPNILPALVARDHHENRAGTGYPQGVSLSNLMVEIVAVVDVYDALLSPRPYRPVSYDNRTALDELTLQAEKGILNPVVVQCLIARNRHNHVHYSQCVPARVRRGKPPEENAYGITSEEG